MTDQHSPIAQQEHRAIIGLCVLAAFADGAQDDQERARIQQIADGFSGEGLDAASVYQDVLAGKFSQLLLQNATHQNRSSLFVPLS